MKALDSRNPNFEGHDAKLRAATVCFIDVDGHLCWIPMGTMDWHFKTQLKNHSFIKWYQRLQAKELK